MTKDLERLFKINFIAYHQNYSELYKTHIIKIKLYSCGLALLPFRRAALRVPPPPHTHGEEGGRD